MTAPGYRFGKLSKLLRLRHVIRNWPRTLVDHLHLNKADYVCHLRDGSSFEVRGGTDDRHVIFEVFVEKIYPVHVGSGDVVVDIGAQIGCFTVWAARQGARVFAFEPFPSNFDALRRNVSRNLLRNVHLERKGVAGTRETKKLFVPENKTHSGRYSLFPERGTEAISVECITLGDIFAENNLEQVDLLKIDCQGAEYEILYEASAETLAKVSAIVVECERFKGGGKQSVEGMVSYLNDNRFETSTHDNVVYASHRS